MAPPETVAEARHLVETLLQERPSLAPALIKFIHDLQSQDDHEALVELTDEGVAMYQRAKAAALRGEGVGLRQLVSELKAARGR